ncbi:MAG: 4-carboxy-4-hydroxy-2-oxoadipate aldolase/oxaloacetate decarboxylase [Nocardioides sp.]|uniref:4-carboxy-4-hydroxy-2-oxoadipate aldolase/oxaloacetate decarboxylase n=1 Tax=Nocardioides sp. TaxID=35761 RepID=UPI0039E6282E
MRRLVVTDVPRPDAEQVAALQGFGVATVHEAQGRVGSLGAALRPIQQGTAIAGPAVTALCWPGDNLMIHAAVEQCRPGDVLVVGVAAASTHGFFGDLLATSLASRGVAGLVIDGGVRDTEVLRRMGFPVWSRHVSAEGTVKATAGNVNLPVVIADQVISAGDVIVADDDGVVVVPRLEVPQTVEASRAREEKETATRDALAGGQLGLDRYDLRPLLRDLGVEYVRWDELAEQGGA